MCTNILNFVCVNHVLYLFRISKMTSEAMCSRKDSKEDRETSAFSQSGVTGTEFIPQLEITIK